MNTSNIKKYAPQARNDFIAAMRKQAAKYGITADSILPAEQKGDLLLIGDQVFPLSVMKPRDKLIKRIQTSGFEQTIDYIAYSWFNRLCAIRYMECKGLLDHGRRVLSSADGSAGLPQILEECLDIDLPGLNASRVAELKLDGNKDEELYRELLLAQCHALNQVMPLLFEQVSDETELLLPDNLTKTDSLIRDLVSSIPEEDWSDVQIIGWLYQFYISEKKDQVIGKVVKSEDIPAATQLFTPNWIVKYLVQNSVGRLWLMAQPDSTLASEWEYYIQPAEQSDEVNAQLKQLIDVRISEDGDTLNPESITVLDPACGSGHILVEAYDCLKAIYLERGYRSRDIPRLILENNLYGIDIDTRAAQLASFALLMKAREDDRRLFSNPPKLNIIALQGSQPERLDAFSQDLANTGIAQADLKELLELFEHASTFGSLIQIPAAFAKKLPDLEIKLNTAVESGDIFAQQSAQELLPLVKQAKLLAKQYDAVIANPPYMGGGKMNAILKDFAKKKFPDSKSDLFSMFIERGFAWCKDSGFNSMVTMQSWMFLSSYETMREKLLQDRTIQTMAHLGARAFPEISGEVVQATAFVMQGKHLDGFKPVFFRLVDTAQDQKETELRSGLNRFDSTIQDDFKKIPGSPIAYWQSKDIVNIYENYPILDEIFEVRQGLATGDDNKFLRYWYEVSSDSLIFNAESKNALWSKQKKWVPFIKGGGSEPWYAYDDLVIKFDEKSYIALKNQGNHCPSESKYFKSGITWSLIGKNTGFRFYPEGAVFGHKGPMIFSNDNHQLFNLLAYLNSKVARNYLSFFQSSNGVEVGQLKKLPFFQVDLSFEAKRIYELKKNNWCTKEISPYFSHFNLSEAPTLKDFLKNIKNITDSEASEVQVIENEINKIISEFSGINLGDGAEEDSKKRGFHETSIQNIFSYAIGCMMGRYSLDKPGLIYAHAENEGFDASRYQKFPADADGIIPLTEMHWFEDDAMHRIREFLTAVWGKDTLDANMQWLAESLDKKANETAEDTIRRYLASKFYKDHMQTYKKRPIYWLFSSGKQGAFQALVYLHRYNESTLARMRTEYVMPLISKMSAMANSLESEIENSDSAAEIKRKEKELQNLHKQQAELSSFEEKLRHYADQRITLDLDDGVKVNYGKFGDLLANVKDITGGSGE